jgi:predicted phage-related endonuclease
MKVVTAEQGTPEWFAARCGVPSGSRFADVMASGKGGAPSATRASYLADLAFEAATGIKTEFTTTAAMQHGVDNEPLARAAYEARTGELVDEIGFCLHDYINCGVSPDGLVGKSGLIEIKCPQPKTHAEYMRRKDAPPAYKWQIQGQLWVMEREWDDFVSYLPTAPENCRLIVRRVYRDEEAIKSLESEVKRFIDELQVEIDFFRNYSE